MNEIVANIALDGGYNPCRKFSGNESLWINNVGCEEGFMPDWGKEYCYKVLENKENFKDGNYQCEYQYDAEMILFSTNSEVVSFLKLLQRGNNKIIK